ncbi:MAG: DUF2341 domain-containing protein [candidate division Zixibacteria bacterium]|nr:DUF2341 domain-containing protein [candidate division Zixibacteria bacterium]
MLALIGLIAFSVTDSFAWLNGYEYRVRVPVDTSTAPTAYQMKIKVLKGNGSNSPGRIHLNNNCQNWPNDMRFTNGSDGSVNFYREQWTESQWVDSVLIWVKIPAFSAEYFLYYGNPSAGDGSNGVGTFVFFESFDNLNNWTLNFGTAGASANVCSLTNDVANNSWTNGLELKDKSPNGDSRMIPNADRRISVDMLVQNSSGNRYVGYSSKWKHIDSLLHTEMRNESSDIIRGHARIGTFHTAHDAAFSQSYQTWYNVKTALDADSVGIDVDDFNKLNFIDADWDRSWHKLNLHSYSTTGKFRKIWAAQYRKLEPQWNTPGAEEKLGGKPPWLFGLKTNIKSRD